MNAPEVLNQKPASFEAALKELEQIVQRLEQGEVTLDEMMKLYERGKFLSDYCKQRLEEARQKIESLQTEATPTEPRPAASADVNRGTDE